MRTVMAGQRLGAVTDVSGGHSSDFTATLWSMCVLRYIALYYINLAEAFFWTIEPKQSKCSQSGKYKWVNSEKWQKSEKILLGLR